jgi:hypothetical protein
MTDFEFFDNDLAIALQRRAPAIDTAGLATASARVAVLARARGIRRRRAGFAGGATLAAVIAGGVLLLNGNSDDTLVPATEPSTSVAPETSTSPSTTATPSTAVAPETSTPESITPASTMPAAVVTTVPETTLPTVPASSVDVQPPGSIAGQSASPNSSSSSSSSSSTSSTSSTIASQGPAAFTKTYNSSGGSITVSWNGSALSLDAVNPAAGHDAEIEDNAATRVRVRFRGPAESRIEIRFENGQVTERID